MEFTVIVIVLLVLLSIFYWTNSYRKKGTRSSSTISRWNDEVESLERNKKDEIEKLKNDKELNQLHDRLEHLYKEYNDKINTLNKNIKNNSKLEFECYIEEDNDIKLDGFTDEDMFPSTFRVKTRLTKDNPIRKKILEIFPHSNPEPSNEKNKFEYDNDMLDFQLDLKIQKRNKFNIDIYNNKSNLN